MYSSEQIIKMVNTGQGTPEYLRALTYIYQQHKAEFHSRLTKGKYRLSGDIALDIYHQGIVILVQKIQQHQVAEFNISGYLWGICHHLFLQHQDRTIRTHKNRSKYSVSIPPATTDNLAEDRLLDEAYRQLMDGVFNTLGEKCRRILLWRQMNYSYREIAKKLQPESPSSDGVIRVTAGRCIKKLIELVEQYPDLKKQIDELLKK